MNYKKQTTDKNIPKDTIKNKITAIIPTIQNSLPLLTGLIESLEQDSAVAEIIVINNAKRKLNLPYSKVTCLNQKRNLFVNKSWNLGIKKSNCEYFGIINDDLILPKNFCSKVLPLLSKDNGIVGIAEDSSINITDPHETNSEDYQLYLEEALVRNLGFGIAMFGHIDSYYHIPENLKINCGDDYLVMKNKVDKKKNYIIKGCKIKHCHQLSRGSAKFGYIRYKDCQNYSKIDKEYKIPEAYKEYHFTDKIIGITNGYEKCVKYKYLVIFGHYIKLKTINNSENGEE